MSGRDKLQLGARERLIFALDAPDREQALAWVDRLGDSVGFYKIGMELLASGDYFTVLDELARREKKIFVDLKFFDIPATVARITNNFRSTKNVFSPRPTSSSTGKNSTEPTNTKPK